MFTTIWEFTVEPARHAEFRRVYGADGPWAALFAGATGFRETILLQDVGRPERFVTLDRWESRAAYEAFRATHEAAYDALDARTSGLARAERHLGTMESRE